VRFLFLLFVLMPIVEMWLLFQVAAWVGATTTIGLVLLTAAVGVVLLRQQGFSTLLRGRQRLETGELPAQEILEGLVLAVSGALLLTPGFVTDTIGFLGLLPWVRRRLVAKAAASAQIMSYQSYTVYRDSEQGGGNTFEGEFWQDNDKQLK
jgi:UPF0716 protein FxsA